MAFVMGFPGGSEGKAAACNAGDLGLIPGLGRSLEKEMATHSSILAWRIPRMEEPGRLQSMGSQRVGHNWATSLSYKTVPNLRLALICIWGYRALPMQSILEKYQTTKIWAVIITIINTIILIIISVYGVLIVLYYDYFANKVIFLMITCYWN